MHNSLCAVLQAELRFNAQRITPYALAILFSLNACLWWGSGPATHNGWATNSDFYIARCFGGFIFLTTPFFVALLMGDPVLRDFRLEIDPLLLATPIRRSEYLLGKFLGNFFTLVLCSSCFAFTLFLLQALHTKEMVVLPWRALPYLKHFLTMVVVSHLLIAAFCFTVGTLTRSVKTVYGAVMGGYLFFICLGIVVTRYAPGWVTWVELTGPVNKIGSWPSAELVNRFVIEYGTDFIANRAGVVTVAALLLLFLHWRFTTVARGQSASVPGLGLTTQAEWLARETAAEIVTEAATFHLPRDPVALPAVTLANSDGRARWRQFAAMVGAEFKLLRHERSLIVLAPLVIGFTSVELGATGNSISYAVNSAQALLLLLSGVLFFYVGEALHRDRELGIEPTLWSLPVADWTLLLSKGAALLGLALLLILFVLVTSLGFQWLRGLQPLSLTPYLIVYTVILLPSLLFVIGGTMMLHVLLRNKYLAHIVGLGLCGGFVWLLLNGYVNGLYNPVLYRLWTYEELVGNKQAYVLLQRAYWLAITTAMVALAHWFYPRGATGRRAIMIAVLATCVALIIGVRIK